MKNDRLITKEEKLELIKKIQEAGRKVLIRNGKDIRFITKYDY